MCCHGGGKRRRPPAKRGAQGSGRGRRGVKDRDREDGDPDGAGGQSLCLAANVGARGAGPAMGGPAPLTANKKK